VNRKHAEESPAFPDPSAEHMQVMHLDTFWIPLDEKTVLASAVELDNRSAVRVTQRDGAISTEELGSFRKYLGDRNLEIIEVTEQEQRDYATNLLNLGGKRVIVPLSRNERVITELESRGFQVHKAELLKLVGGYGAVHCLTAPVMRE
jgi:arginine deiminase